MVRQVDLYVPAGSGWSHVGSVQLYRLPVRAAADFRASPAGLVTLEEARRISLDLAAGKHQGTAGRYSWFDQGPPP